jgi:hypothetical protein
MMSPVTGTENGMGIVESADTIGLGDFELLTVASLAGLFRTASANPIEDIKIDSWLTHYLMAASQTK